MGLTRSMGAFFIINTALDLKGGDAWLLFIGLWLMNADLISDDIKLQEQINDLYKKINKE